jgi:hypothetical protein
MFVEELRLPDCGNASRGGTSFAQQVRYRAEQAPLVRTRAPEPGRRNGQAIAERSYVIVELG